jgi:hypothetical protein
MMDWQCCVLSVIFGVEALAYGWLAYIGRDAFAAGLCLITAAAAVMFLYFAHEDMPAHGG